MRLSASFSGRECLFRRYVRSAIPARYGRFHGVPADHPALAIVSIFGGGIDKLYFGDHDPVHPEMRALYAERLAIREIPYVDAARAMGFSHSRIILRHMVPNVMAPFLIMITAFVGQAILTEAPSPIWEWVFRSRHRRGD